MRAAARRPHGRCQHADRGRLAGPVGAEQGEHLACRNLERDPLHRLDAAGVNLAELLHFDHGRFLLSHRSVPLRLPDDGSQRKDVTVEDAERQAREFEAHRAHLRAVAYRMLGSLTEADDAVQESWFRLHRSEAGQVENMRGWLTTVVARVSLDMLRARRARREDHLDEELPEPIVTIPAANGPEDEALLADSVGLALLVVLDTLTPA